MNTVKFKLHLHFTSILDLTIHTCVLTNSTLLFMKINLPTCRTKLIAHHTVCPKTIKYIHVYSLLKTLFNIEEARFEKN